MIIFLSAYRLIELKYLNSLRRIRDGTNYDPGWKKFGSGIWDKHPGFENKIFFNGN
jgi:hypothetical protein